MTHTLRLPGLRPWLFSVFVVALGCSDSGHSLGQLGDAGGGADGGAQDVASGSGGAVGTGGSLPGTGGVGLGGIGGTSTGGSGGASGAGGRGGAPGSGGTGGGGKAGNVGGGGKGGNGGTSGPGGRGGAGGLGGRGGAPGGAGGAVACSALPLVACPSGQICDYNLPNRCGAGYVAGTCIPTPGGGCTADFNPVCGCNGTTYSNDCARATARVQLDHVGACNDSSSSGGAGGGGGGGGATVCMDISTQYQAALPGAKMCSLASGHTPCQVEVPLAVGCSCRTYVDNDTTLKSLITQWSSNACTRVCPAIACTNVQPGNCVTSGTAASGTCQ